MRAISNNMMNWCSSCVEGPSSGVESFGKNNRELRPTEHGKEEYAWLSPD